MRARAIVCAVTGFAFATAAASTAAAEWQVKRSDEADLAARAARAFAERPADAALARRLIRLVGRGGRSGLRTRVCGPTASPEAHADDVLGCATLLFELAVDDGLAAEMFARAEALVPSLAAAEGRGRALARAGRRDDARTAYDTALAYARRAIDVRRVLEDALALYEPLTDPARELALRERLAALDPKDDARVEAIVDVLERLDRRAEAAQVLEAHLPAARVGDRFELTLRLAKLLDAAGQGERAAAAIATLLAHTPRPAVEKRRLAWECAVEIARRRDALPALADELARTPGQAEWNVLSEVRDELGDLVGALEAARHAAGLRPSSELGRRIVALLERLGRDREAEAAYEAFGRAAPRDPAWPLSLIEHEQRRGQRRQAALHLDAATTRFRNDAEALARLADLAGRGGEDVRAVALWERLGRLRPHDERVIRGLGEAQFAAGHRALSIRTWQRLRDREPSRTDGRLSLVEVLLEHDLVDEARAQLPAPGEGAPRSAHVERLRALILERQGKSEDAVRAWDDVLVLARGEAASGERREARARILSLLARTNRARLDERIRALADAVRKDPRDREQVLFLAEAQQRSGDDGGATTTLRALLDGRDAAGGDAAAEDSTADVTFALARLLRLHGGIDEATRRLEDVARHFPARAREAHALLADFGLARHDATAALAHAREAARLAPEDGEALARVAAIEERTGQERSALETYERAFARDASGTAGLALARLHARDGDADGASRVLHRLLQTATDDDVLLEAGRLAVGVDEYLGRLTDLDHVVAGAGYASRRAATLHRVRGDVLRRLVPALTRDGRPAAREELTHIGRSATGALLALVTEAGTEADRGDVELLGLLGNADAVPVLVRIAAPSTEAQAREETPDPPTSVPREAQLAAVIALGRLSDARAHDALSELLYAPDPKLRAASVWAIGRLGDPRDVPALSRAAQDPRADVAGAACLGLGRTRTSRALAVLAALAENVERPLIVRRAAIAGLALGGDRLSSSALARLAVSGDPDLEGQSLLALGAVRAPKTFPLVAARAATDDAPSPASAALRLWADAAPAPDEALSITGPRIELEALFEASRPGDASAPLPTLWLPWTRELAAGLDAALSTSGARRANALAALDDRDDGLGLGRLLPSDGAPITPAVATALATVGAALRPRLTTLADDADPVVRARARRILEKLDRRIPAAAPKPTAPAATLDLPAPPTTIP